MLCIPCLTFAQSTETDLLSAAQQAFNDGFSDMAVKYLEDFLNKFPESPHIGTAKLLLGQCDFLHGDYDKALGLFGELSQQRDNRDEVLFWRGETYLKQNHLPEAQDDYRAVIREFPKSVYVPQSLYSLGWTLFQEKKFDEARSAFARLARQFPNHQLSEDAVLKVAECAYDAGQLAGAIQDFQDLLAQFPKTSHQCEAYYNMAEASYGLGRLEDAADHYAQALDSSCADDIKLAIYTAQGWNFMKLKSYGEAQAAFKKALNFGKAKGLSTEEVLLGQANLSYEQGFYDVALLLFSDFIKDYPQSPRWPQGYLGRANVYYLLKRYEDARGDYLRLYNQGDFEIFEKARFGLGWCELKMGNPARAKKYFQEVVDKSPDANAKANAMAQLADVDQENSQWEEAIGLYERVKKTYPGNPAMDYVLYRQAIAFLKSGMTNNALDNFKKLKSDYPDSRYLEDSGYYLGIISFKKGDYKQSAQMMQEYLKHLTRPSEFTPEANYILALSALNEKDADEALKVFQKILRLYPNDAQIAKNADIGIAKSQYELGQYKEAVRRFKLIAYKYPKTETEFEALLWLSQYYLKSGDAESAAQYYKNIIDEFPDAPQMDQIHYELGQAYEMLGRSDEALEQYQAISNRDESLKGKTRVAMAGIMSHDLDPRRAIAAYESIMATSPEYAGVAFLKLGQLFRNSQNYEKELELYQKALAAPQGTVDRAQIQFNLADTLQQMSRTEDAIAEFLKIPDLYPSELVWVVKAYLRVAKIYEDGRDWEGARVTYHKIVQLNSPEAAFARERLDWIKNNARKARD